MAITSFPNSAVCYILADIPGVGKLQGSGAIIGPHTILTASHLLWEADVGAGADAVSVYPGYVPEGSSDNPAGALGGTQTIHFMKVADGGGQLPAKATQSDYAVIDTSVDLSRYGRFALDPHFRGGDAIVNGYPASNNGYQQGDEKTISATGGYADLNTASFATSPGYSGGPIWDDLYGADGSVTPAVAGIVSTHNFGTRITSRKIQTINHWIASDVSLWRGGGTPYAGTVPQIAGTASSPAFAYQPSPSQTEAAHLTADPAGAGAFSAMVDILHRTQAGSSEASSATTVTGPATGLAAPADLSSLPAASTAGFVLHQPLPFGV